MFTCLSEAPSRGRLAFTYSFSSEELFEPDALSGGGGSA